MIIVLFVKRKRGSEGKKGMVEQWRKLSVKDRLSHALVKVSVILFV